MDHTTALPNLSPQQPPPQHQYGTRIRQNSVIKPSARLRQSPDPQPPPRKPKQIHSSVKAASLEPQQADFPAFPPSHVMLHPEDANSKVLLAIGRSLLSVNNCAMTIKDLAEMTMKFGLICQNASAAGQAITTYIRAHMQRCDAQQDHPLLLRHVLSGTPSDDDLLPALYSRTGGAHCTVNPENRTTNFRRGTMVWYLSKATGAPCPFARAGIRLCEYGENGRVGLTSDARERKRERDRQRRVEQCSLKRKRLPRGCADKGSDSESEGEDGPRPPKVKLTLRLKPNLSSFNSASTSATATPSTLKQRIIDLSRDSDSEDSMSVDDSDEEDSSTKKVEETPWSLPPYPRRSISIPCYTPSFATSFRDFSSSSGSYSPNQIKNSFRRSPSVPYSVASPPPDSEDEDEDYHITMTGSRRFSDRMRMPAKTETSIDWDLEFDSDGDAEGDGETETQWESPGPRSPSAPIVHDVAVKQEPRDVRGMLDAWEDFDSSIADAKVVEIVTQAAAVMIEHDVKLESPDLWDWNATYSASPDWYYSPLEDDNIKEEDVESDPTFLPSHDHSSSVVGDGYGPCSPLTPLSSISNVSSFPFNSCPPTSQEATAPRRDSELVWKDVELLGPDSIQPQEFEEGEWEESGTFRSRIKPSPSIPVFSTQPPTSSGSTSPLLKLNTATPTIQGDDSHLARASRMSTSSSLSVLIKNMSMTSKQPRESLPSSPPPALDVVAVQPQPQPQETREKAVNDVVVVHTCQPCTPAISATQVEGISVYQLTLGSTPLLRRIDTDFVNLSTIVNYLGLASSALATIPNAVFISKGSANVSGCWVPLGAAQAFVRDHSLPGGLLDTFLSDMLFERFPSALQDFHRSNAPGRLLNQFGPHFSSTVAAQRNTLLRMEMPFKEVSSPWERESVSEWDLDTLGPVHPPFPLVMHHPPPEHVDVVETPLSATEQEMFHALCAIPDWEKENSSPVLLTPRKAVEEPQVEVVQDEETTATPSDLPLRRSKRVANAIAAQSRTTRTRRGSSRNSLS